MPNWKKVIVSGSSAEITTLKITGNSGQSSEATSLMINSSGVVGTRELGSNAFNSTTIPTNTNQLTNGAGYTTNVGDITGVTAGTGISGGGTSGTVTITNSDRGSSQNIFKNVAVSGQTSIVADSNNDTLTFAAGAGIGLTTNATTDTITITNSITNNNQLTNGAGYITDGNTNWNNSYGFITGVDWGDIGGDQADINISGFNNDAGYITSFTNTNQLTTFQVEDGDGTEVTISHGKEWKFVEGESIDINWTDTSNGSDTDPYDLTFSLKPAGVGAGTYGSTSNSTKIDQITIDAYGRVTNVTTGGTGDITGITAGVGLSGGGNSGNPT